MPSQASARLYKCWAECSTASLASAGFIPLYIAGTPGLPDPTARAERAARDDALATALRTGGLPPFLEHWYRQPMWAPLRASPR